MIRPNRKRKPSKRNRSARVSALVAPRFPSPPPTSKRTQIAEFQHWVYAAVRTIADAVASAPAVLYVRRTRSDGRSGWPRLEEIQPRHPLLALLAGAGSELWRLTATFLELTGDAYWYLPENALGRPARIELVQPQFMRVVPAADGSLRYEFRRDGRTVRFSDREIVHLRYPDPASDFYGKSPLAAASDEVATYRAMKRAQRASFENGAFPGLALSVRGGLSDEQLAVLRRDIQRLYAGPGRAGRTLVLDGDIEAKPITFSPSEMAFLEGSRAGREEILSAFGVPAAMLGIAEDVNRASIDGVTYAFMRFTIQPKLRILEEAINRHICPRFSEEIWCEFELDVPRDRDAVRADWEMGLRHGAVTVNEYRTLELGLTPVPWGDRPWLPASRVQVGRADARGALRAARLARLAARLATRTLGPSGSEERNEV